MCYNGEGVPQDYAYAYMWGYIAASNGHEGRVDLTEMAAKEISPDRVLAVQELSRECVRREYKEC